MPITWKKLTTIIQGWIEDPDELPAWLTIGRTVLIPKTPDLSLEKEYRPVTCLNTSCKILTGILAKCVKQHAVENDLLDKSQMGTCEKVFGTVDQLIIVMPSWERLERTNVI